jgi:hypothetical protein
MKNRRNKINIGEVMSLEDIILNSIELNKKVAYLSGSISLDPNYYSKFEEAEKKWSRIYEIINPCKIEKNRNIPDKPQNWRLFMINDIQEMLSRCDTVIVLRDWYLSRGSIIEIFLAQQLGLNIIDNETGKQFMYKFNIQVECVS